MNFLTLHFFALIISIPAIIYADHLGFLYFTGRIQTISHKKVQYTHWFVTIGLMLLIVSGVIITIPAWALFFGNPLFYVKIGFVIALCLNGIFIGILFDFFIRYLVVVIGCKI